METRPNFFIVGAAKSGSTALLSYLDQHPEVEMCAQKEIHYFGSDLVNPKRRSEAEYLALFSHCRGATRIGDKSVWYLYSERAAGEIEAFAPDAEIVMILRNPVAMMHSLHQHFVYMGSEPVREFEAALELDPGRESGEIPRLFEPRSYRSAARYTPQVRRFIERFGSERVSVVLFEEFMADPASQYSALCGRLGIDPAFEPAFSRVNAARATRSERLNQLVRRPPPAVKRVGRAISTRGARGWVHRAALRLNRKPAQRDPMDPALAERLAAETRPDIAELGELLGRDLSAWTEAAASGGPAPK